MPETGQFFGQGITPTGQFSSAQEPEQELTPEQAKARLRELGVSDSLGSQAAGITTEVGTATPEQLEAMGVDVGEVDLEIENQIEEQKGKTLTEDQFFDKLDQLSALPEAEGLTDDEIYNFGLELARDNGFTIQGIEEEKQVSTPIDDEPGFFRQVAEAPGRFVGAGIAQLPDIIGNVGGFFIGKPIDALLENIGVDAPSLEEQMKQDGIKNKAQFQEILGIEPDDFTTTLGEFGAEVGSLFIPGGQAKLAAKFPAAANKIRQATTAIGNLSTKAPKLFATLKAAAIGAKEAGKFQIVSEGELTKGQLAFGGAFGATLGLGTKLLQGPKGKEITKAITERFGKLATKLSPSRTTKLIIDKELEKGTRGAFTIRELNKDLILKGDDAVSNVVNASRITRQKILKEMAEERGVGGIDVTPVAKWADDMIGALQNRTLQKKLSTEGKKQFKELAKLDSDTVIKTLQSMKAEILSPAKGRLGKMSLNDLDELIISNNSLLGPLFSKASGVGELQALKARGALNSQLIKLLDKGVEGSGAKFRQLKQAYGDVRTFENNLDKVYAQILRKKDAQLGDYADTFIFSNMATSIATGDVTAAGKATLQKLIKEQIKKQNDPNFVLEKMFELVDKQLGIKTPGILPAIRRGTEAGAEKVSGFLGGNTSKVKPVVQPKPSDFKLASPAKSAIKQTTNKAKNRFDLETLKKTSKIGEGTDRVVFDIGNNKVLKVAKNPRGIDQNLGALNVKLQKAGILPKVDEVGKDFVIMEKLRPFNKLTKVEQQKINNLVDDISGLLKREADVKEIRKVLSKHGWKDVADLDIKTFGWGDVKPKNLSIKNGKPILIDEGTIELIKTLKKYKRKLILAPIKVGAIAAFMSEVDVGTLYEIGGTLFGGDVLKNKTQQELQRNLTPRG